MLTLIFFTLWFFAPAGFANLAAFLAGKIQFLNKFSYPADCYMKFRGKRILGNHKTVRGFIAAILVGIIVCSIEVFLYDSFFGIRQLVYVDYSQVNAVLLGALLGFGALFGDALKSFFKRQFGISPGTSWFPFDQIDYIRLSFPEYFVLFVVWFLMHPLLTFIGYLFKLRHQPI
jgi:CDP-2,3-bis-(O-geranylgeranyl)-sn-glycerol synthase